MKGGRTPLKPPSATPPLALKVERRQCRPGDFGECTLVPDLGVCEYHRGQNDYKKTLYKNNF